MFARDFPSSLKKVEEIQKILKDKKNKSFHQITNNIMTPNNAMDSHCFTNTNSQSDKVFYSSHDYSAQQESASGGFSITSVFGGKNKNILESSSKKNKKMCDSEMLRRYQEVISSLPADSSEIESHTPIVIRPAAAKNMKPVQFDPYVKVRINKQHF